MIRDILAPGNLATAAFVALAIFIAYGVFLGEWSPLTAIAFAVIYAILMPSIRRLAARGRAD